MVLISIYSLNNYGSNYGLRIILCSIAVGTKTTCSLCSHAVGSCQAGEEKCAGGRDDFQELRYVCVGTVCVV